MEERRVLAQITLLPVLGGESLPGLRQENAIPRAIGRLDGVLSVLHSREDTWDHSGSVLGFWVCEFSVETVEWPTDRPCELVVGGRNTHAWPPNLDTMPSHWTEPFAQLAGELELRDTDIGQRIEFAADEFCFWHIHLKRYLVRRTR